MTPKEGDLKEDGETVPLKQEEADEPYDEVEGKKCRRSWEEKIPTGLSLRRI